jgi:hypothetical protein
MAAIITDQLRILNANNFASFAKNPGNSFYTFIGLSNSSEYSPTWNINPISPRDSFEEENSIWDTVISLKRIKQNDIKKIIVL